MSVIESHLSSNGNPLPATSFLTDSISPTANRLVLITVTHNQVVGSVVIPTITGAGMTWDLVKSVADAGNVRRCSVFRAMSASPGSGQLTIDFASNSQGRCEWSISEFDNIDTSGTNGDAAIVQSNSNIVTASAPSTGMNVTLSSFSHVDNAAYGGIRVGANTAIGAGSGMTEIGHFNQTSSVQSEWDVSNNTSVGWTWSSQSIIGLAIALEIKSITAVSTLTPRSMLLGVG